MIASNITKFYVNQTVQWANASLVYANKTVYDILILTNKTVMEEVIPFVNQTTRNLIAFVNRTRFQPWNATLNETIYFLNGTSVVLVSKANETYVVLQSRAIETWKNLTSEENIAMVKTYFNMTTTLTVKELQRLRSLVMAMSGSLLNETKLNVNKTLELVISTMKDEYSLINELPMRALDKTLFELSVEMKEYIQQLIQNAKVAIESRDSFINRYPVMYLNMTVFEVSCYRFTFHG